MTDAAENDVVQFEMNRPQALANLVMPVEMWVLAGRGTGKTVGIIAPWILHKVQEMPRSYGGIIGQSFSDLETKILEPLFLAFSMLGYEKGKHFTYGTKPPDDWETCLTPIIDYKHTICFPNGTAASLISLHLKGSANAKSLQWVVGDEAKFLDEKQLREEVFPVLRGHANHFGDSPWYGAKLFVTDKLSPSIQWILAKRKLVDHDAVSAVLHYQVQQNELKQQAAGLEGSAAYKIARKISRLEGVLALLRKKLVYVVEASAKDNIANLRPDYFENMRRSLTDYEYRIAIDNEDPTRVENNFYPDRNETHLYDTMFGLDEDKSQPLGVALDYQASLSPLVSFQLNDRVMPGRVTLNFLKDFYVKAPLGMKHVIQDFCNHHRDRPCKEVYYFYDHTASARRNMHKKMWEEVVEYFEAEKWTVTAIYMGQAPLQPEKHRRIRFYLQNETDDNPLVRIHKYNCASMLLSMDLTPTKETDKGTHKDKSSEKKADVPQEQATHFSDVFDMVIWAVLEQGLYPQAEHVFIGMR